MAVAINPRNTLRKFRPACGPAASLSASIDLDMPPLKVAENHIAVRFAKVLKNAAPLALCIGRQTSKG